MSRFVTAGSDKEYEAPNNDEWAKAERQIQESKKPRLEPGMQEGGKTLYETLQANKAAKQEAFEEKTKLKNQFRSLDEDEIEFLDSVLESTRAQEALVKKQTSDQLASFRKQQEDVERASRTQENDREPQQDIEQWTKPRKRKHEGEKAKTLKIRKPSTPKQQSTPGSDDGGKLNHVAPRDDSISSMKDSQTNERGTATGSGNIAASASKITKAATTSLVAYDSDSDG